MIVFRLTKGKYKSQISGIGAELYGGRWNNKGFRVIYTSQSRALCTTEIAVHTPLGIIPTDYYLQTIEIPNSSILKINPEELSKDWKRFPHPYSTKILGDQFIIENEFLSLKVPSAIVQDENNFLINPNHKMFKSVEIINIEKFEFDKRLFNK
jgi:RES domain-containing protein